MKLKDILFIIICYLICYLLGCIINAEFDMFIWNKGSRIAFVIISTYLAFSLFFLKKSSENDK